MRMQTVAGMTLVAAMGFGSAGCETKAQTGTLVGAGAGAAIGGLIGSTHKSSAGVGAAIGAGVGAIGGYVVGNEMDKKDQRERDRTVDQRAAPERGTAASGVQQADVIAWTNDGVKDEMIIDRIERSGSVFRLTAADENKLRDAGVSEEVVRAMKNTARRG
jgi:uncharacterized protein YcfJ